MYTLALIHSFRKFYWLLLVCGTKFPDSYEATVSSFWGAW